MIGKKFKLNTIYGLLKAIKESPTTQKNIAKRVNLQPELTCVQVNKLVKWDLATKERYRVKNLKGSTFINVEGEFIKVSNPYYKFPMIYSLTEKGDKLLKELTDLNYMMEYID